MISAKDLLEYSKDLKIIYAEDEDLLRNSLSSTLEKLFAHVHVAKNGQEAIDIFDKEEVDLVLTDINMPLKDGIEFIKHIRESKRSKTNVMVLTAHDESDLLKSLISFSVDSFINKPTKISNLLSILYKNAKAASDSKMVKIYQQELKTSLANAEKKNRILMNKLYQIAYEKNIAVKKEKKIIPEIKIKEELPKDDYFENLISDDIDEINDLSTELGSCISTLYSNGNKDDGSVEKISLIFSKYASVLNSYPEFSEVGIHLAELSNILIDEKERILESTHGLATLLESFEHTLLNFKNKVWDEKADNPEFFNISLISDIQFINNYLTQDEEDDSEIDFF